MPRVEKRGREAAAGRLVRAALAYRRRGWSVIPVANGTKRPLIKWRDFTERLATKQEIRGLWKKHPDAAVGIVTGRVSGLLVIDFDPSRGGDPAEFLKDHPTKLRVRTGGGGMHAYYRYPEGETVVRNSTGAGGIDVRGDGGFVVAPPSRHASGRTYRWAGTSAAVPGVAPLEFLTTRTKPREESPKERWVSGLLAGVAEGERNTACARLAGYFLSRNLPPDVVEVMLLNWNRRNQTPLADREVRQCLESVLGTRQRTARDVVDGEGLLPFVPFASYMAQWGGRDVEWLVDGWLPDGTVGFAVAPPGTYKTWLLLDLAVSVAGGVPFLGQFPVHRAGPVLIMQQEDAQKTIARRLALIVHSRFDLPRPCWANDTLEMTVPPDLPIWLSTEGQFRFDDPQAVEALSSIVRAKQPVLCVLDPLYSAADARDYMSGAARSMLPLKGLRDTYGCSFLVAHHTRKVSRETGTDPEREQGWGSQFLNAFQETSWQVRPAGASSITVSRVFKVSPPRRPVRLTFDISTEMPSRYTVMAEETVPGDQHGSARHEQLRTAILDHLKAHGGATKAAVERAVKGASTAVRRRVVAELIESGEVVMLADGARHCLWLAEEAR